MLAQRGRGVSPDDRTGNVTAAKPASATSPKPAAPKPEKRRMANKDRYALERLPGEIDALGETIARLEGQMNDPALFADSTRFAQVSRQLADALAERDAKEEQWLELEALREEIEGEG